MIPILLLIFPSRPSKCTKTNVSLLIHTYIHFILAISVYFVFLPNLPLVCFSVSLHKLSILQIFHTSLSYLIFLKHSRGYKQQIEYVFIQLFFSHIHAFNWPIISISFAFTFPFLKYDLIPLILHTTCRYNWLQKVQSIKNYNRQGIKRNMRRVLYNFT